MALDVVDLQAFYATPLGQTARRMIRRQLRELWPQVDGQVVVGLGYAVPYLRPFREESERVLALMPAAQGVVHWPAEEPGLVALADEGELPLPDASADRILLVHGLEASEQVRTLLREIWRVLAPGGRLVVVVPNRRSLWARIEATPFGHGQPFSRGQIDRLLRASLYQPTRWAGALWLPPVETRFILRLAPSLEKLGGRWWPRFPGVFLVEATKQIYAATGTGARVRSRMRPVLMPSPARTRLPVSAGQARQDAKR
ncbi:class I SAM-dependent methyltransferase [Zavarzinia sp. CC-PAN008]|uniref:class I SAM-dependent methyltransferase n=1 Tax=Zavarzinia sp. CC-PAN008 TaxID=3243332 RepID=UPI003F74384A